MGDVYQIIGPVSQAISYFREAMEHYRTVPDYAGWAETLGDLAQAHVRHGDREQAFRALEESHKIMAERQLKSHQQAIRPYVLLAEARLLQAEHVEAEERDATLRTARALCRHAIALGKRFSVAVPSAARVTGTYDWLRGEHTRASASWRRGLAAGEALGARYEVAKIHAEIGKRTGDRGALQQAETIFAEIGATLDLNDTRRLLFGTDAVSPVGA